ncbi:Inositol 2-dehydrogenase/D-chiro-inositol 3-dehydrogenase [Rubripirellula lacrimiformis]|uniref:Inositol 2-dehydrogenase/D-chiro-inositol 3-dehydrogenase n=1 Tax=Rubripirellula lacrimiformis TaxID=1930273 RepID=A0A517NFB3_9BACT|nr:Gfo/Idh/MocA family oxidoreductase [Rubripirellula lacrimiformis]QDT05824.1 Inositol 2-dehydrogenase/D-chiro-inositol 3-dehydrogenase [Rubripirellula lacrimiformis]
MTTPNTRRDFLKTSGKVAAATTLISTAAPKNVHAAEDNTIRIALVGCGGRGTGAALNALSVDNGPIQLVAIADVFEKNLNSTHAALSGHNKVGSKVDCPAERQFIGFDAYRKAMDVLKPGDVVILATPPGFRWVHYSYAIERGLNVFMEKPVTIDAPTSKRMLDINKQAVDKNLKVGVGLMCRHCRGRQELFDRIQSGEIGDLTMLRAYRMAGPTASAAVMPNDGSMSPLFHQIKNFHGFLWLSGGAVSDFLIHNIDESCWMKNAWPEKAIAIGGRHYRGDHIDQNFDTYAIEYTFADGAKLFVDGRTIPGCKNEFASFAHGTKGSAVISAASHTPAKSKLFTDQAMSKDKMTWAFPQPEPNPYDLEWVDLIDAIRQDRPYNEVERGVMASAVTSMGRMAAHTGQEITLANFMEHKHEFAPEIDKLTMDSDSPLMPNAEGKHSVPMPGLVKKREYL